VTNGTGYCLSRGREKQYLVYLPSKGSVDVSVTRGTTYVTWINAQNPTDQRAAGTTSNGQGLRSPNEGDDLVPDFLAGNSVANPTNRSQIAEVSSEKTDDANPIEAEDMTLILVVAQQYP